MSVYYFIHLLLCIIGYEVRKSIYTGGILNKINQYVVINTSTVEFGLINNKILVPGAGLGRLSLELAANGYKYYYICNSISIIYIIIYILNLSHKSYMIIHII